MIAFKQDVTLTVVESFDEKTEKVEEVEETFKAGEFVDGDIVDEEDGKCQIEFGDGSQTYGVPRETFDVL